MEEIYENVEYDKSVHSGASTNQTGPRTSEKRFFGAVILSLGLLSIFLLAVVIGLSIRSAELSTMKANLSDLLKASDDKLSSLTGERDLLQASLLKTTEERNLLQASLLKTIEERNLLQASLLKTTEERNQLNASLSSMTEERDRLQKWSKQKKTCPAGWTKFSCSCYLLSGQSGSWTNGRDDCRRRGADLVVIDSAEEQTFLTEFTQKPTWIGLSDLENEGTWTWIDGTPLTLKYWAGNQPDNGGGDPQWGEEDCAHIRTDTNTEWNDLSCKTPLPWICENL